MLSHPCPRSLVPALIAAAGLMAALVAPSHAAAAAPDAVVARVGSDAITVGMLTAQLARYYGKAAQQAMIDRAALDQDAARYKLTVTPAEVTARIKELAGDTSTGADTAANADDPAVRDQVKYALLAEKVVNRKWPISSLDLTRYSVRYIRVATEAEATEIAREARRGVSFDALVQRSLDRDNGGQVLPEKFFRIDRANYFNLVTHLLASGDISPGHTSQRAVPAGSSGFWFVLRLDAVYGPETLKPTERKAAIQRITAVHVAALPAALRKRYSPKVASFPDLERGSAPTDAVVAEAGPKKITEKQLYHYLLVNAGSAALEQLVERTWVSQEAQRLGLTVTDREIDERLAPMKRSPKAFEDALNAEGITETAWRDRLRYVILSEKIVDARSPLSPDELQRMSVSFATFATKQQAERAIQAAKNGTPFDQIEAAALDHSASPPKPFLRVEDPEVFKAVKNAGLKPGEVLPDPVQVGNAWMVVKLEALFGPDTMTAQEVAEATHSVNAARAPELLTDYRKRVKVDYILPLKTLIAEAA